MAEPLLQATVAYQKRPGSLALTKPDPKGKRTQQLVWTPDGAAGTDGQLRIDVGTLKSLFSSKEGGAKVMIRVAVALPTGGEEMHNFTFLSGASAVSDREHFKRSLAALVAINREGTSAEATPTAASNAPSPAPAAANGAKRPAAAKPSNTQYLNDPALKQRVLDANPDLGRLFKQLVIQDRRLSEAEFWDGREHLLEEEQFVTGGQRKGRNAQPVDPRPQATTSGDLRISITAEVISEIFEQYPVVQRAYSENVPPLKEAEFWNRYFQSRLFSQYRSSARSSGEVYRPDAIFDRYLGEEDDELEPRHAVDDPVNRLLDLAATAEDHVETGNQQDYTMRAGSQRGSLPLMRRFNEHSERLLDSALGKDPTRARTTIDGGNAGARDYYREIELEDLQTRQAANRVALNMQDQHRYASGRVSAKRTLDDAELEAIHSEAQDRFRSWRPNLPDFSLESDDAVAVSEAYYDRLRARATARAESGAMPASVVHDMNACHGAANEYLRLFWTAVAPDAAGNARLTTAERSAKATRMANYLARTPERVELVVADAVAAGVERERIEAALAPMLLAVQAALDVVR